MKQTKLQLSPGDKFGRGTVLEEIRIPSTKPGRPGGDRGARLLCSCGTVYEVRLQNLISTSQSLTQSCGCLAAETARELGRSPAARARLAAYAQSPEGRARTATTNTANKTTHGMSRHPLYNTWHQMMNRCYDPDDPGYQNYGARGIRVCERWHDARLFIADIERTIGPRPPGMTLDRKDNDSPYAEWNVRWATRLTQNRNSRRFAGGQRNGPVYQLWYRLMRRCPDELYPAWHVFAQFAADLDRLLGPRPAGMRFDRADDSLPYAPGNIGWVTGAQQVRRALAARWKSR